jgi:hypothetical protein
VSVEQYWMGKDIDLDQLWKDFDGGSGYGQKVTVSPLHLLRLTFGDHPPHLPLFDHEVIFNGQGNILRSQGRVPFAGSV